ncbi:MAG: CPBP family intramembrane glutamic endopeptidase [Sphingobacteriaceae bacterium]
MIQKPNNHLHPAHQLSILILLCVGFAIAGMLLGTLLVTICYGYPVLLQSFNFNSTSSTDVINALKIIQMTTSVSLFLIPAICFAKFIIRQPESYLRTSFRFPAILLIIVFLVMFSVSPLMELLINLNQKMIFPDFLKGLERWMREMEDKNGQTTTILLKMNTFGDLLLNLLMVGVLPAIAEEFLFRGCMQTIFIRWTNNIHWGVWISAAIFSAIHVQFFGFLPRLMLGALFGYLVVWSGSIWPAVLAHFINNGTAVLMTYFYQQRKTGINPEDQHLFDWRGYVLSFFLTLLLLNTYRRKASANIHMPVI